MNADEPFVEKLRDLARSGASLKELLDVIHEEQDAESYTRGIAMYWFCQAFSVSPMDLHTIFGWKGFGDGATASLGATEEYFRKHVASWLGEARR